MANKEVIVISNENVVALMCEFEQVMKATKSQMALGEESFEDNTVIAEVFKMLNISTVCCYRAVENKGSVAYERSPTDPRRIVTHRDCMGIDMTGSTCQRAKPRSNSVTICNFATRVVTRGAGRPRW